MFATSAVVLSLAAAVAYAQDLSVQMPSLAQCANSVINFSGGSGPYYVAILHGKDPCDNDAIQEFYNVNGNSVSYTPALPSNTQVFVYVEDSNGQEAWSDAVTIGDGDSSCLTNNPPTNNYNPPTNNYTPPTNDPPPYTPPNDPTTNTPPPYNPPTDNNTANDGANTSYQSPANNPPPSSSSASTSTTGTTYEAPYNPAPKSTTSVTTHDANVQSTNGIKDTTPANVNDKNGSATGLAASTFTTLCAVFIVSFGLF